MSRLSFKQVDALQSAKKLLESKYDKRADKIPISDVHFDIFRKLLVELQSIVAAFEKEIRIGKVFKGMTK